MNPNQATDEIRKHLDGVEICNYEDTLPFFKK